MTGEPDVQSESRNRSVTFEARAGLGDRRNVFFEGRPTKEQARSCADVGCGGVDGFVYDLLLASVMNRRSFRGL